MDSSVSNPAQHSTNANSLDDIFGSSPPHDPPVASHEPVTNEPSDLPTLRRQHVTAGYRDGVSASKSHHVQEGFDAGFPIGAQLGMRAGTVLGILEGLVRGYESRASSGVVKKQPRGATGGDGKESEKDQEMRQEKRERILKIYRAAVKELEVQGVFAGLDGNAVMGEDGAQGMGGEKKKPEVELKRMGDKAIAEWEGRVSVAKWEENMDALELKAAEGKKEETEQS